MSRLIAAALAAFVVVVFTAGGPAMAVEEPPHTVVEKDGAFEIRRYEPTVVAEVVEKGDRTAAANAGFRTLAGYIFGANAPKTKIAMTAPVTQTPGEKIAMTAPVTQTNAGEGWVIGFVMPKGSTLAAMPAPRDPSIKLREVPGRTVAALRFSGFAPADTLAAKTETFAAQVRARGYTLAGPVSYGFYDPPWTLPFMRRNEVMADVRKAD